MKIIPTAIQVSDLKHDCFKDEATGELRNRSITGTITIDFVSSSDMTMFVEETINSIRIFGLSEAIIHKLLGKEIEL